MIHIRPTNEEDWTEYNLSSVAEALKEHFDIFYNQEDEVKLEARYSHDSTFSLFLISRRITITTLGRGGIPEKEDE